MKVQAIVGAWCSFCAALILSSAPWAHQAEPLAIPTPSSHGHLLIVAALRGGDPHRGEVALGALVGRFFEADATPSMHGVLLQVVPGVDGGRVALGYGAVLGVTAANDHVMAFPVMGLALKGLYARSWGDSEVFPKRGGYFGIEAEATLFLNATLGIYRRPDDDVLVTFGLGVGF